MCGEMLVVFVDLLDSWVEPKSPVFYAQDAVQQKRKKI